MDDNYPTLKRPKKKLVYPITKTCGLDRWAQDINSLEDVDKMFDDLDFKNEDVPLLSPEIHIPKKDKLKERDVITLPTHMMANDHKQPHPIPVSPELDMGTPFKAHGPIQTSSPMEENAKNHDKGGQKDNSVSPILFNCEDDHQDLKTAESSTEKPSHDNSNADESENSVFETLPKKSNIMSAQKIKTVRERSKPLCPPATPARKSELKAAAPEKSGNVQVPAKVKLDMTSFLQKLKDAKQHKPTLAKMSEAKALPPLPEPEPEDDFVILEDDVPLCISIPNKYSKSMKEKRMKKITTEAKDSAEEEHSSENQQDIEKVNRQQESQALAPKPNPVVSDEGQYTVQSDDVDNVLPHGLTKRKRRSVKRLSSEDDSEPDNTDTKRDDGKLSRKIMKEKKTVKKESKPIKNDKVKAKKKTPAKENRRVDTSTNGVELQNLELNFENLLENEAPVSGMNNVQSEPAAVLADIDLGHNTVKRRRKPPGEWWITSSQDSEQQATDKNTDKESVSSVQAAAGGKKENLKPSSSSSDAVKRKEQKRKLKRKAPVETAQTVESDEVLCASIQDRALDQDSNSDSSPILLPHRESSITTGAFQKVYQNTASAKKSSSSDCASLTGPEGPLSSQETPKRRRKFPGNWWQVNPTAEDQDLALQSKVKSKKNKPAGKNKKQAHKPMARSSPKPLEGTPKQTVISNLVSTSPPISKKHVATLKKQNGVRSPPAEATEVSHSVLSDQRVEQDTAEESMAKIIRSGPSSMIVPENCEEGDNIGVSLSTVQPALSVTDLCSAPLRPLILQPKDEVNLQNWLKFLWPTVNKKREITANDFKWYSHRGKAMGILVDLETGSICTGRMLLGSSMKKPLWVDHSATTVFNLLTGSVSVEVDCSKSLYNAGQSFMVPPGHAYSIHNVNAQPAVLYFTRVFTDDSDE